MNIYIQPFIGFLALCILAPSCIRDEAANAECDITRATLHVPQPENVFFSLTDSTLNVSSADSVIRFDVRSNADLSQAWLDFELTAGAHLTSLNDSVYRVSSEDGLWHRDYTVCYRRQTSGEQEDEALTLTYSFEQVALDGASGKYYRWAEGDDENFWATGNPGFRLSQSSAAAEDYPTTPLAEGKSGKGVKLTTRSTGALGNMVNMRLASGNLFIGSFEVSSALLNGLSATRFGRPFTHRPMRLKGFYKYEPGADYMNANGQVMADSTDRADIYAVFYRNTNAQGNSVTLDGTNVRTSSYVVALAQSASLPATSEWTEFELPFNYQSAVDGEQLMNRGYSLTIVFASSRDGNMFSGAIGSTLCIDEVTLICNQDEK